MEKLRPDILEILEFIGRNGELPYYFSDDEKKEFIKNIPILGIIQKLGGPELREYASIAYRDFDNELLMRVVYILMGYHFLETMCSRYGYGGAFGSPTFLGANVYFEKLGLDDEIHNFIRLFVDTYGGNYYSSYSHQFNSTDFIKVANYLNYLKNRNLQEYFNNLKLEKEKKLDEEVMSNMRRKIAQKKHNEEYERREEFLKSKTWYPYAAEIEELENDIRILKTQVFQSEKRLKYYKYLYAQTKIIPELLEKSSKEILLYLVSSPDPVDFYEPLCNLIKIEDINNLNQNDYNLLLSKLKVTKKNSKFRKLYKVLIN